MYARCKLTAKGFSLVTVDSAVVPQLGGEVPRDADIQGVPGHWHSTLWPAVPHPGPLPGGAGAGRLSGGKGATEALCLAARALVLVVSSWDLYHFLLPL